LHRKFTRANGPKLNAASQKEKKERKGKIEISGKTTAPAENQLT